MAAQDNEQGLTYDEVLRKKEEEEKKRRVASAKYQQDAVYWEEMTEDVQEREEAEVKADIEEFEQQVIIEKQILKEHREKAGEFLKNAAGAVVAVGGAAIGAVETVADKIDDALEDDEEKEENPEEEAEATAEADEAAPEAAETAPEATEAAPEAAEEAPEAEAETPEVFAHGVEPLAKAIDVAMQFAAEEKTAESDVMQKCHDTLSKPVEAGNASDEYKSIMDSLTAVKDGLSKDADPEQARKDYVKNVHKVLNNINRYRVAMASKGVELDESTMQQIIGVERVDSLLRDRYQTLEQREYEDTIGAVAELFQVETDKDAVGDDYLLQQGLGKINNMKKQIEDFREEFKSGRVEPEKDEAIELFINNPLERDVLPAEPAREEREPVKVEDEHLAERREIEKEAREEEKKAIEEGERKEEKVEDKKLAEENSLLKKAEPEKEKNLTPKRDKKNVLDENLKKIYQNDLMKAAIEKEDSYRKGLDPTEEYGKLQMVLSAKKSLYLELLGQAAGRKMAVMKDEKVEEILEKGLRDFNKSAKKARAFMTEFVGDKDFNKEFGKRVIEGSQKGLTSHEDLMKIRDEALESCYKDYKGKDMGQLDKLSAILGSDVNSKSLHLRKDKVLEKKMDEEQEKKIEHKLGGPKPLMMGR